MLGKASIIREDIDTVLHLLMRSHPMQARRTGWPEDPSHIVVSVSEEILA
jgi:hypothetical protein